MHILDIHIDDSNLNPRAFSASDNSVYDENINVTNRILEITPPGFSHPIIFRVKQRFKEILNSNLLHLNTSSQREIPSIPDGLYKIKYSVDPNISVYVELYYFRNVKQQIKYFELLTEFLNNKYKYNSKESEKIKRELIWINNLIKGAKYMAEDNHQISKANTLYKEIDEMLENFKIC